MTPLRVTFLGTATSSGLPVIGCDCRTCTSRDPRNTRFRASVLLQWNGRNVVVDTGPEFRLQMVRAGVRHLDAILMTHEHADHIYGMDDVRLFTEKSGEDMPVYSSKRTASVIRQAFPYIFEPLKVPGTTKPALSLNELDGPFALYGQTVHPLCVLHGRLPISAFRIGDFAYVTDCSEIPPETEEALEGLDTLVLGALRHDPHPTHFTLQQAVDVAQRLAPRRTYFTHIGHHLEHAKTCALLPAGMALAHDGLVVDVPCE